MAEAPMFYAWVEVEPNGREGVIAALVPAMAPAGPMLLQHRTREIAERFRDLALAHGRATRRSVRFVEYQQTRVLEEKGGMI